MALEEVKPKVLIVGKHEKFLDILIFSLQSEFNFEISSFTNTLGASSHVKENTDLSLIIIDSSLQDQQIVKFLRSVDTLDIELPILLIGADATTRRSAIVKKLISVNISKSDSINQIFKTCHKFFERNMAIAPKEYCAVKFSVLTVFNRIEEELFIQLPTGRHLKIFSIGDEILDSDVQRYAQKGVHELYIKKATYIWLLNVIKENIGSMAKAIEEELSTSLSLNTKSKVIKENKLARNKEKEIVRQVKKVLVTRKKVPSLVKILTALKSKRDSREYYPSHTNLLNNILIAFCNALEWRKDSTIETLIYASMLHDLPLSDNPHLAKIQMTLEFEFNEDAYSAEEKEIFLQHPLKAKEIAQNLQEAPLDTATIVYQHHEKSDGSGFPQGIQSNKIHPLASLFIVSHDLVHYILTNKNWTLQSFLTKSKSKYKGANFVKVTNILSSLKV